MMAVAIDLWDYIAGSSSRIAEKIKMFRQFFVMGNKSMNLLTKYHLADFIA